MDKDNIDNLGIERFDFKENSFSFNDKNYAVSDLVRQSKKYEPFDLPLAGIDLSNKPWGDIDVKKFAYHMIRINEADMSYPIILDTDGYICDGWHRLVKAIITNQKTIKAIRLTIMPDAV